MIDLGDTAALAITITDSAGVPANATTVVCSITRPDGTTDQPAVVNSAAGAYQVQYAPSTVGVHLVRWVATGENASAMTDAFVVEDPTLIAPVSFAELKKHLNITTTTQDDELRDTLTDATAAAELYTGGRALTRRSITETLDGNTTKLILSESVALSVTSVVDTGTTLTTDQYRLKSGVVLERRAGPYVTYFGPTVTITYVVGVEGRELYNARRAILALATHFWATQRGSQIMGTPRRGESEMVTVPGSSYSIPNRAAQLLDPLRLLGN